MTSISDAMTDVGTRSCLCAKRTDPLTDEPSLWIKQAGGEVYLTREQARVLLPRLQRFADKGD